MRKKINMIGWVMKEHGILDSKITVLEEDTEYIKYHDIKTKRPYWKCQCECGQVFSSLGASIRNGKVKSCGCLQKERTSQANQKDLTGQVFGKLTVLKNTKTINTKGLYLWECQCSCGNKVIKDTNSLSCGHVNSCGCSKSKGEQKITKLLEINSIPFQTQYIFSTCRLPSSGLAKFDFYINDSFLLEFDGQQHYYYTNSGWNTKEKFQITKTNDNYKNSWCRENNIPLKRIPYWALDTLTIEDIMSDKFLVKENKSEV